MPDNCERKLNIRGQLILLDNDIMIDLFREYPPAKKWFDSIDSSETMALSGFVLMELIQGCKSKIQLKHLQSKLTNYETIWLSPDDCESALNVFTQFYLSHNAGLIDVLVGITAVSLEVPLYTFNGKHYQFIPRINIIQRYSRTE